MIQIREGIFSDEEMREIENGFSVSETSVEGDDDIQSSVPSSRGGALNSIRHSPGDILALNSHFMRPRPTHHHHARAGDNIDIEARVRIDQ